MLAIVLASAIAARFAFESAATARMDPSVLALASAVGAAIGIIAAAAGRKTGRVLDRRSALALFFAGAAAAVGAPLAVAAHRYSDAPPGSEVLFLTTASWAAVLVLFTVRRGTWLTSLAGCVFGLAGVMGVVANWERPSSFSLFVRYRAEELWMLAAGFAWALLWVQLERARKEGSLAAGLTAAAAGTGAAALALSLSRWGAVGMPEVLGDAGWWSVAAASAAVWAASVAVFRRGGARLLAAGWFLPAVALTGLTAIEQAFKPLGIQPILLEQAAAGAVIVVASAWLVAGADGWHEGAPSTRSLPAAVLAAGTLVCAVAALATPALLARVTATRADGSSFQASFTLLGLETVGGWAALGLALVAVAAALWPGVDARKPLIVSLVCFAAFVIVWQTPLHTLSSAIPYEIQVDYGSEFASIRFEALSVPWMWAAAGGATLTTALVWWRSRREGSSMREDRGDAS